MPAPKQSKTTRASPKKKTKLGGPRPGAGRPPIQPNRAAVKIRLDTEVISAVDTIATLQKLDRSRVIEGALRQWLKQDKWPQAHEGLVAPHASTISGAHIAFPNDYGTIIE